MKNHIRIAMLLMLAAFLPVQAIAATDINQQRKIYQQAKKALQTHQLAQFRQLREQLGDYPLQEYLDYLYLQHRINDSEAANIKRFLQTREESFFKARLRSAWLDKLARDQQWQQYLEFYQGPQSAARECHYARALIATNQPQAAAEAFEKLWLVSTSQDKACDPVFQTATQRGWLTDDLRWQRMMLALRNQQFPLANYLAKTVQQSGTAQAWAKRWEDIHNNPVSLLSQLPAAAPSQGVSLAQDVPMAREIIVYGLKRLARQDFEKAYFHWKRLQNSYLFSIDERHDVQGTIGMWAALNKDGRALYFYGDTPNHPWRVRAALWQQNWKEVQKAIGSLDENVRQETRWQYWLARSMAELGQRAEAEAIWRTLVDERDFYAFLAADKVGAEYEMNHRPIVAEASESNGIVNSASVKRMREFYLQDELLDARREAYFLQQTLTPRELQIVANETHKWGWHNQTIALLGTARYWDALDLRFPVLYGNEMRQASANVGVDASWLLAIARQESAFNPQARSHAGAMGLMQVMPATGKQIGGWLNKPLNQDSELYNPARNIEMGSFYIRRMQDQFQSNPVLATAAYNAGPHRVSRWLPEQTMPADIWVENIPFTETRRYVRAVLSFAATYDYQLEVPIKRMSERMPAVRPRTR
jgi:soluble lytic murein transglycosylase